MAYEYGHDHAGRATRRVRYAVLATALTAVSALAPLEPTFAASAPTFTSTAPAKAFTNGNATAISQAVQIVPRTGGLSAALALGTTIAQFRANLAQASSQAINLGVVGTILTVQCDASPPILKPSELPQALIAESTHGNSHAEKNTAGQGSAGFAAVAGHESVEARTVPEAIAGFDGAALDLPGLVDVSGMHTANTSRLIPGKARIATATSTIGELSLLKGTIVLSGLSWTATDRTGTHPFRHSSFSIGGASLAGKALPVNTANISSTITTINKLLAPIGLHISLPYSYVQAGTLNEAPLIVGLDNSKVGGQVVNPVLDALLPITNPLRSALNGITCKFGSVLGAVDLATAAIDGTGGVDVKFGGASAATDDTTYKNPFGNTLGGGHHQLTGPTTTPSSGNTSGTTSGLGTGTPTGVPPVDSGTQTSPPDDTAPLVSGTKVVSSSCSTTSPANRPSCSQGEGLMVGLIAIAAVAAIAGADYLVMRRRRKLPAVAL